MGSGSSKGSTTSSANQSAEASPQNLRPDEAFSPARRPRRRESIQVLPATAAAPVESHESATGQYSKPKGPTSHSRNRSQTATTPLEHPTEPVNIMGNQPSTDKTVGGGSTPERSRSPALLDMSLNPNPADPTINEKAPSPQPTSSSSPPPYYLPGSQFGRAPRLPLPIEEEILSPGSPIITPADVARSEDQKEVGSDIALPRRSSVLSSTTVDEEDVGDELTALDTGAGPTVDTLIEWKEGGERVYVTGTFAKFWTKKFRLHKNGPSKDPDAFSAIIPLPPGTHHLTFLVDSYGRTSKYMPTAVDWSNMLVNYIEISVNDLPRSSQPQDIPQNKAQQERREAQEPPATGRRDTPEVKPAQGTQPGTVQPAPPAKRAKRLPPKKYHNEIPKFLLDLDAPEESSRFQRANAVMATQPAPPSLPMFLNKSILNGATPMKDDASVLIMPNHTVLNHLATSSIKEGVLATSATTRYKKKYVTTIMYKPTGDD